LSGQGNDAAELMEQVQHQQQGSTTGCFEVLLFPGGQTAVISVISAVISVISVISAVISVIKGMLLPAAVCLRGTRPVKLPA